MNEYDAIVIGAGQAGMPLAIAFATDGKRTLLIEREHIGGTCINSGCTPSKAFLASAHAAGRARNAATLGVHADVRVDFRAVMERVHSLVTSFRTGSEKRLTDAKVHVLRAGARFVGTREVEAAGERYTAPIIIINTGGRAQCPPITGLDATPYLDNANFFELRELPKRVVIIGAGYIALELGQGLARCGASVTLINRGERILSQEAPEISDTLAKALENDGVRTIANAMIEGVSHDGQLFHVALKSGEKLEAEAVLIATGRRPNSEALNLSASGISTNHSGFIEVNEYLETACSGIYAVGDVAGQPAFTHVAWEDHRRVLSTLRGKPRRHDDLPLAYAVFTEPQVGRVGFSLEQAKKHGLDAIEVAMPITGTSRASEWAEDLGFSKIVVDNANDEIIGATLVGYEAGELIHVFVAHMMHHAKWQTLDASMHIHPTYAEGYPGLARMVPDRRKAPALA